MAQAQIKIDQAGKPAGVAGVAREDLDSGTAVTLSAAGGSFLAYRWSIVSKPIDPAAETNSSAGLSTPTSSSTLCSPIDVPGTHLVELLVDSGRGLGATEQDAARITFYAGPPLAADARHRPRRRPAFAERREHNVADAHSPGGNPEGWAREMARVDASEEDAWLTKGWASGVVFTGVGPIASVARGYNVFDVTWNLIDETYDVVFQEPLPDANYAVLVTPAGSSGWVIPMVDSKSTDGCSIRFTDATAPGAKVTADFSFRVELGVEPW